MKTSARSALVLSTLLLLGSSAAALGATNRVGEIATKTVSFRDLDLSTSVGAQTLYGRIAWAARVVCRDAPYMSVHECRARAVDDAVKHVGSALLVTVHRSSTARVEEVALR